MGIYNGVWVHLYRQFISGNPSPSDRTTLLPSYDDVNGYEHTPGVSTIPSGAGVYVAPDKDSVNG